MIIREYMIKKTSLQTRIIEKSLDEITKREIDMLTKEAATYNYQSQRFESILTDFSKQLTEDELITLRSYTGYNYKKINAILRNNWNYEEHGRRTDEEVSKLKKDITVIDNIMDKFPTNNNAFIIYRGTTISEFKKYGITSLDELTYLIGSFIYEEGYTSTSLNKEESYFNKEINGKVHNIETKYIIPPNSNAGMPLTTYDFSYSSNQEEYLLKRNTLSKVINVVVKDNTATITAIVIPKQLWDKMSYQEERNIKK